MVPFSSLQILLDAETPLWRYKLSRSANRENGDRCVNWLTKSAIAGLNSMSLCRNQCMQNGLRIDRLSPARHHHATIFERIHQQFDLTVSHQSHVNARFWISRLGLIRVAEFGDFKPPRATGISGRFVFKDRIPKTGGREYNPALCAEPPGVGLHQDLVVHIRVEELHQWLQFNDSLPRFFPVQP